MSYDNSVKRFLSERGRIYWGFAAYFLAKQGVHIAVLLMLPILVYFSITWVINARKG